MTRTAGRSAGELSELTSPEEFSFLPAPSDDVEVTLGAFGIGREFILIYFWELVQFWKILTPDYMILIYSYEYNI